MIKEKENIKHLSNKQKNNNPDNAIPPITFFFKADMQIRMKKALSLYEIQFPSQYTFCWRD